ncbi:hypothetical protein [Crystallibacter degradans]|uniref:hypothetical protein n=1 Tax=Crystallibacter degradans TaxID=2726743 RepID=UPI00147404D8|nr:hypothetical protein [Arthrobacter sp. SF27]NMR32324.1 hypothetical protein [Arthrobacter sp. SF27]
MDESVCGLPGSDITALGSAPESRWELVGKVAAPVDPQHGPGLVDETGLRSCFARSPTGALFAAANILALGSTGDAEIQKGMIRDLTLPGPGRDKAMEDSEGTPSESSSLQVAGFQIDSYSPQEAHIDIAFRLDNTAVGHINMPLRWSEGDWKIQIGDAGQLINDPVQLNDLSGYIPWSGV